MRSGLCQKTCISLINDYTKPSCLPRALRIIMFAALNRVFTEWNQVFPNATCVVALIDRLVHRSEILPTKGTQSCCSQYH